MSSAVSGSITIGDASPKVQGFGTILIMTYHTHFPGVREYSADKQGLTAMLGDGFTTASKGYRLAATYCSQTPHGATFKIGRLNTANAESITCTVNDATAGGVIGCSISSGDDPAVEITRVIPAASSVGAEATALAALIDAIPGLSVSAVVGATFSITPTSAAVPVVLRGYSSHLTITDATPAVGYAADLAAALAADPDWYGLAVEGRSDAAIGAAAAFAEANAKVCLTLTANSAAYDAGSTTDIISTSEASGLHRTGIIGTRDRDGNADVALMAIAMANTPGTVNLATCQLSGPRVDSFTLTEANAIEAKHGITYARDHSIAMTTGGWAVSGRYLDLTMIADLVTQRIDEGLTALLAREKVVRMNNVGRSMVDAEIRAVLTARESEGSIIPAADPVEGWRTYVPTRAEVPTNDRIQRRLPGINASFTASGAVNKMSYEIMMRV